MACSYAKAWANHTVRKNFNFLENILKHGRPQYYVKNKDICNVSYVNNK